MYEMLMIQNAQMHQMIMQQLMLSTVPRPAPPAAAATAANSDDTLVSVNIKDLIDVRIILSIPHPGDILVLGSCH